MSLCYARPARSAAPASESCAPVALQARRPLLRLLRCFRLASALLFANWLGLGVTQAVAQTAVSGAITSDTRWSVSASPYLLSGDVVVQGGAMLTIDAGVVVYMAAAAGLTVQAGGVQALGTVAQPVQVRSDKSRSGQVAAPGSHSIPLRNRSRIGLMPDRITRERMIEAIRELPAEGLAQLDRGEAFRTKRLSGVLACDRAHLVSALDRRSRGDLCIH